MYSQIEEEKQKKPPQLKKAKLMKRALAHYKKILSSIDISQLDNVCGCLLSAMPYAER